MNASATGEGLVPYPAPITETVVLVTLSSSAAAIGTTANGLVILAVLASIQLRTSRYYLLVSLSISDLLSCALWQPFTIQMAVTAEFYALSKFLSYFAALSSLNSLVFVTAERFVAVFFPYVYLNNIYKERNMLVFAASSYVLSFVLTALRFVDVISLTLIHGYIVLLSVAIFFIYIIIYATAVKQDNKVKPAQKTSSRMKNLYESKTTKTVGMILGAYYLCWIPYLLLPLIPVNLQIRVFPWVNYSAAMQSLANPFIYFLRFRKLRYFVRRICTSRSGISFARRGSIP